MIKQFSLEFEPPHIKDEIKSLVCKVIDGNCYVNGRYTQQFEEEYANYCNVKHSLLVNNGTTALHLMLSLFDDIPKINIPAATFIATAEACWLRGIKDKINYIDVNDSYLMDHTKITSNSSDTNEIFIPVSLYGNAPKLDYIRNGVFGKICPDLSQSHGCKLNGKSLESYCPVSAASLYVTKPLAACGECGILTFQDTDLYNKAKSIYNHGQEGRYNHIHLGFNGRVSEIVAATALVKLNHLDNYNKVRRAIAARYRDNLKSLIDTKSIELLKETENSYCVYHQFPIFIEDKKDLQKFLLENDIETGCHYSTPIHQTIPFKKDISLPKTEKWAATELSLPIFIGLTSNQIDYVSEKVIEFFSKNR